MKNKSLAEGGHLYGLLHRASDRMMTAVSLTLVMLIVAMFASFYVPTAVYLGILFGPGLAVIAFGGMLTRAHWSYNLSTNQRLAIERYRSADEETKKLFPKNFEETVRNASNEGYKSDAYQLAEGAQKILNAATKRKQSLNLRDDRVEVALEIMRQSAESLEVDAKAHQEIYGRTTPNYERL